MAPPSDRPRPVRQPAVVGDAKASPKPCAKAKRKPNPKAEFLLSRQRRPESMDVADWQRGLRRQFGRQQAFTLQNLGGEPVFSDFEVHNPASQGRYRVATDAATGAQQLRLPLPDPGTLQRLAEGLAVLAAALRRPPPP